VNRSIWFAVPLAAALAGAAVAGPAAVKIPLLPQHGSKIGGTATLAHQSMKPLVVDVSIVLDGVFIPEASYPAGLYIGTCAKMSAAPAYELKPVVGGRSETRLRTSAPKPGPYVIAVLKKDGGETMSCGALPEMKHKH
jgi:hypothetical protein